MLERQRCGLASPDGMQSLRVTHGAGGPADRLAVLESVSPEHGSACPRNVRN